MSADDPDDDETWPGSMGNGSEDEDSCVLLPPSGIPPQRLEGVATSPSLAHAPAESGLVELDDTGGRPRDSGALVPPEVTQGTPLSPEESKQLQVERDRREEEEQQRVEEFLESEATLFRVPRFVTHPLVMLTPAVVLALLGLFVFAQVTTTLAALETLPLWARCFGWGGLTLLGGIVVYAGVRFLALLPRLKVNQPVRLKSLAQLSEQTRLRWLVRKQQDKAKEEVQAYVKRYPYDRREDLEALVRLGFDRDRLAAFGACRSELLSSRHFPGTDQWFDRYSVGFQGPLDQVAGRRVGFYAKRVALMTASSPNALIDALVTTYGGLAMLTDLCRIYNLRVSRLGTAVLLARVFTNAYLAGRLQESEAQFSEGIQKVTHTLLKKTHLLEYLDQAVASPDSLAIEAAFGKLAGKIGARSTSGVLNYFMFRRLGTYAIRLLQPVRPQ